MGNYITSTEVKAFKVNGSVIDLVVYTDAEIDTEIALAEEIIESLTCDYFYPNSLTAFIDGNGLMELYFFPAVPAKCVSLTSVEEVDDDGVTVLDTYTENDDFKRYDYFLKMIRSSDQRPRLRFGSGGRFPKGEKNIKVVGIFGRTSTPEAIKRAAMLLVLERLKAGSTGMSSGDVTQAMWPDFQITFRGGDAGTSSSGFPEIDRLIAPYINMSGLFQVVPDERTFFGESVFRS